MAIRSTATSHVGMVRKLNEDSLAERSDIGVWAVADGMGGHEAGEIASQMVTDFIKKLERKDNFDEMLEAVTDCLQAANHKLLMQAEGYNSQRTPGSTVVALIINRNQGAVVWAGDSRIYRRRDQRLTQLTRDHSHVQDLVEQHMITPEEAETHPMANVITRAVGIEEPLDFETRLMDVQPDDQFILCSDGLTRLASNQEIEETLASRDAHEIVQSLLHKALVRGAPDNVTIILVQNETGDPNHSGEEEITRDQPAVTQADDTANDLSSDSAEIQVSRDHSVFQGDEERFGNAPDFMPDDTH